MQKSNTEQTVFIITGMHRSGTSLTASILQSAGIHIGRNLLGADQVNIKGHWENIDFYEFHMNILNSQGLSSAGWTLQDNLEIKEEFIDRAKQIIENNALSSVWGWKEPRTTLFLDFWAKLLPEARFLLIYRSPWEVADSLYRRKDELFQSQPELAIKYWQHYNQKILNFYNQEQNRCLLANVKTIIQYQAAYIDTINHKFNVDLSHPAPTAYDPSMLKTEVSSNSQQPTVIDYYFPETIELYQELEGRAWHPEQTPDFSWQELLKPSLYRTWAFQDWANLRRLEQDNKSLKTLLHAQEPELQESQSRQTELEQTKAQLKTAENLLEQSQFQLHETESVLEKSQTQLQQTESVLQQSHAQLNHTRKELEQTTTQLGQAQFDVMRYQSQLHQTQEELEYYELHRQAWEESQSKLYQAEVALSQLMNQLQKTEKSEERLHIQLHQTQEELEYYELHRQAWEESQSKLYEAEVALSQLMDQLQQAEKREERINLQRHQTLEELEQTATKLKQEQDNFQLVNHKFIQLKIELEGDIKQKEAQIHQWQTEFKQSQSQLHELQQELAQAKTYIEQITQRHKLEQIVAESPDKQSELDYNLLVWDAWNAYCNGQLPVMKQHLQNALKLTKTSASETIMNWLESFSKFSVAQGLELDSESLTNSLEWQQLMRQVMVKKMTQLPMIKH
ncbi:sulfotransferase [Tychonema sp. LEGE 06208]|uniref:sulfotransferase n=1 Tax=Tychonema sp. LEGE 06208 TaxID=1828663 RepID=UPI001881DDC6|nr:sulfotransferase [Tychonema sp. LEGE 06208]MBE9164832.1 sulfotransferase [Tychonema sp. LEGE 06208]